MTKKKEKQIKRYCERCGRDAIVKDYYVQTSTFNICNSCEHENECEIDEFPCFACIRNNEYK